MIAITIISFLLVILFYFQASKAYKKVLVEMKVHYPEIWHKLGEPEELIQISNNQLKYSQYYTKYIRIGYLGMRVYIWSLMPKPKELKNTDLHFYNLLFVIYWVAFTIAFATFCLSLKIIL